MFGTDLLGDLDRNVMNAVKKAKKQGVIRSAETVSVSTTRARKKYDEKTKASIAQAIQRLNKTKDYESMKMTYDGFKSILTLSYIDPKEVDDDELSENGVPLYFELTDASSDYFREDDMDDEMDDEMEEDPGEGILSSGLLSGVFRENEKNIPEERLKSVVNELFNAIDKNYI